MSVKRISAIVAVSTALCAFSLWGAAAVAATPAGADGAKVPAKDKCIVIHGEYVQYNGYPPFERIKVGERGKEYGLISSFEGDEDYEPPHYPRPESLVTVWDAHEDVVGEFVFCLVSDPHAEAYLRDPMSLGWIKSFNPVDSSPKADFIRKIKIAVINTNITPPDLNVLGGVRVSFDYLDGVASNVKLEHSSGNSGLDKTALSQVAKTEYPKVPTDLKGQTLHISLDIYFPPDAPLESYE